MSVLVPRRNARRVACLVAVLLCVSGTVRAHTVAVEQLVHIVASVAGGMLQLHLDVPLTAVSDAGLVLTPAGTLPDEATAASLTPVATLVLRNLDLRDERALRLTAVAVVPSSDRRALSIDASFQAASLAGVSASLNAFQSQQFKPVVTALEVRREDGGINQVRVAGAATRTLLDPGMREVVSSAAGRAARAIAAWQAGTLMLLCLLALPLTVASASRRVGVLVAGQVVGALVGVLVPHAFNAVAPFPALVAGALVVLGGLHMLFGRREVVALVLAGIVGVLDGALASPQLIGALPMAGAHRTVAVVSFFGVAVVAVLWLAALLFSAREWLTTRRGVPARVLEYAAGAFVVHAALHLMFDAGAVSGASYIGAHAAMLAAVGCALLVVAVAMARGRGLQPAAAWAGETRA